ncbi:MAG: hypothetical protein DRH24_04965 [Deltaproteobacteria bacterium]|nr:MAG: hypothetical protein DRH24_04965 [Deltaproteobacteria bacterium]
MSLLRPIKSFVEGIDVLMIPMEDLYNIADNLQQSLSEVMIMALQEGIWPESLVRNYSTISAEQQISIIKSRVVIVGLGGLGGYLASLSARAGIGNLVLVDGDAFDFSNLNRQVFCTSATIGENKASVAAKQCSLINPAINAVVWETDFSIENGMKILASSDLVMDGLDQISTRKTLLSISSSMNIPLIHGAVRGWSGQVSIFLPESRIDFDHIYPENSSRSPVPSVLSSAVAIIASIQIQEAIRLLCGYPLPNMNKLIFFDGEAISFHKVNLSSGI